MAQSPLFGRSTEIAAIDALLDGVRGRGAALVIRGEPGIGKSALLEEASRGASRRGMLVLRTVGVQSEATLAFAGLHQLLRPILPHAQELRAPQRDALLSAFGMGDRKRAELFPVALAALQLLATRAAHTPSLLVVEDAHWLDRSTRDVLTFVARRIEFDPLVLLVATRDAVARSLDDDTLPELRLEGLADEPARALLDAHAPDLAAPVRRRLLEAAAGNPLALVELPIAAAQLGDGSLLPAWLPLTTRLERAFAARVSGLPGETRTLLLAAAVDDGDALREVLGAASTVVGREVTLAELMPAVDVGLLDVRDTGVRFRHPLVRSAVHHAASIAERHAMHAALAVVLAARPERAVWHKAASCVDPDEAVAIELDSAARGAERRGGTEVAVTALERAAALSEDPGRRGGRLLRAAELAFELGRHDVVVRLLEEAEPLDLEPLERARAAWLRELFDERPWSGYDRVATFVQIADRMRADGDPDRALQALLTVALRLWWSNPDQATRDLVATAADALGVAASDPALIAVLACAVPLERGAALVALMADLPPDAGDAAAMVHLGTAATAVGAYDQAADFHAAAAAGLRAQGRLGLLAEALVGQAWTAVHQGTWKVGAPAAEEAARVARETGQPRWGAVANLAAAALAAMRGEEREAERLAAAAERIFLPMGANPMLSLVQIARGTSALAGGRHADAFEHLFRIFDPDDLAYHPLVRHWAIADLVDAAVHAGERDAAARAVADLEPLVASTRSPQLTVAMSHAQALLASDDEAEELFSRALAANLTAWPFARARLLLAYGAWLRRQRRVADSRAPLRGALEAFDALGLRPWHERAQSELRAAGAASRPRSPDARDELTPQELHIAQLAAEGLSNREIGQRLYLSHRTVGSHLYRIFPKLGVTSRAELRDALHDAVGAPA